MFPNDFFGLWGLSKKNTLDFISPKYLFQLLLLTFFFDKSLKLFNDLLLNFLGFNDYYYLLASQIIFLCLLNSLFDLCIE